jgi:chemosensory pili system protein ChpA (sensor histidine kinase/response regulator)
LRDAAAAEPVEPVAPTAETASDDTMADSAAPDVSLPTESPAAVAAVDSLLAEQPAAAMPAALPKADGRPAEPPAAAAAPAMPPTEERPDRELAAVFALEVETGLQIVGELLTTLVEQTSNTDQPIDVASRQVDLLELQRQLHTLKGAAAMLQQQTFASLAHHMEDVVERLASEQLPATRAVVGLLLEATGALETLARAGHTVKTDTLNELTIRFRAVLGAAEAMRRAPVAENQLPAVATAGATVRAELRQLDQLMDFAGELITNRAGFEERLTSLTSLMRDFERSVERLARVSRSLEYDYEAWGVAGERPTTDDEFDSLEFDRYTEFHRLAGELAEAVADVRTISRDVASGLGSMTMLVARQRRVTTSLREGVETMRLVPLAGLSPLTRRIVRQAALADGKEVAVETSGLETQVDRTIYEALTTSFNHLLRNAVVHGIEPADRRQAAGKVATGRIGVEVRQEHHETVVVVRDDGAGIDRAAVRRAAEAQGWLQPGEEIADGDLLRLIFRPRLSTTETVDESAGRGVGLDAVLAAVNGVRGRIEVESTPGEGTTFTLYLPLVMVVGNVLLVECGGRRVALPMRWLDRTLRLDLSAVREGSAGPQTTLEGEQLPVVRLADLLGWPVEPSNQTSFPAIVANAAGRRAVVLVDALVQRQELAISSLGPSFAWLRAVQGATILGSGQIAPVLDLAALLEQGHQRVRPAATAQRPVRVLVCDDSLSVRRVVTIALERQGWQVVAARNGAEALEVLSAEPVDLALLDIEMPQMDGYSLLERLRASQQHADLPVAMLTSRAADKHRQRALQLGAQAYLVKPYQEEELLSTLRSLLADRGLVPTDQEPEALSA